MAEGIKGARAKPVTVEFNGEEYKASPLTFDDFGTIWDKMQSRKLALVQDSIENPQLRREMINDILNAPMSEEFLEQMGSFQGVKLLVTVSLQKNNPDIEEEDIGNLPADKIEELSEIITSISGLTPEEVEEQAKKKEEIMEENK